MRSPAQAQKAANAQVAIADYVPLGTHVAPNVVKLKRDTVYLASWRLDGITFDTKDPHEIAARKVALNHLLRSLGDGRWSVWTHKIRRNVRERLHASYANRFCDDMIEQYYATFDRHRQMATQLFLTLVYRPEPGRASRLMRRFASATLAELRDAEQSHLTAVADAGRLLENSLAAYGPARLTTYRKGDTVFSEPASLYAFLINGFWEEVPLRYASLDEYLPASRLFFGDRNGMLQIHHPLGHKYAGFLDIQDYPPMSEPGMCNGLLYGSYEYVETQSLSILARRAGIKALQDQAGHMEATEDVATSQAEQMRTAMDQVQAGHIELGEYHYSLAVFGDELPDVARNLAQARAAMVDLAGFKMATIDVVPECAWFAQIPGNWRMRPRSAHLTTRNFASLSPFHGFAGGKRDGNPWGPALALFQTPSGQPFYLNLHATPLQADSTDEKAAGNTFICGATGVGKTTLQMLLLASATQYPGFRALCLDLDRGSEIGIRAMGGKYTAIERGKPTGFNPFQLPANDANERFCTDLVKKLIAPDGSAPLTAREEELIQHAVRTVLHELPHGLRRLSAIDQNLPNVGENSLRLRLKKWLGNNPLGWVFDNPRDTQQFDTHAIYGYDYTEFLDQPEIRTPVLMYLLHVGETLKTGQPFIRIVEEFWKALLDDTLTEETRKNLKTDRKLSALGVYVTQSPSDVLTSPIGRTIVEQCVTQIYLPNPRADAADYIEGFKLSQAEFAAIKGLGEQSRMFLVKQGHQSALVRFDLSGLTDVLNVISGSLDNVRLLDAIREETGDDPQAWLPVFHERIAQRRGAMRGRAAGAPLQEA